MPNITTNHAIAYTNTGISFILCSYVSTETYTPENCLLFIAQSSSLLFCYNLYNLDIEKLMVRKPNGIFRPFNDILFS